MARFDALTDLSQILASTLFDSREALISKISRAKGEPYEATPEDDREQLIITLAITHAARIVDARPPYQFLHTDLRPT